MMSILLWLFVVFFLLFVFFIRQGKSAPKGRVLGIEGELLYADQGRKSKAFVCKKYRVRAKPDFLIRLKDGRVALVEYKSRSNDRVYISDIVQAKVSVLAARVDYPVEVMFIKTPNRLLEIPITRDSDKLHREVEHYIGLARRAQKGELLRDFTPNLNQCKTCSVRTSCQR